MHQNSPVLFKEQFFLTMGTTSSQDLTLAPNLIYLPASFDLVYFGDTDADMITDKLIGILSI